MGYLIIKFYCGFQLDEWRRISIYFPVLFYLPNSAMNFGIKVVDKLPIRPTYLFLIQFFLT